MKNNVLSLSLLLLTALVTTKTFASEFFYTANPEFKVSKKGNLLVGKNGLALYTFKKDVGSPIPPKCTKEKDIAPLGACLVRWPAATTEITEMPGLIIKDKNFGAVYNNEINKLQLTYAGLPVYYWFKDSVSNNFTGDGVGDAWSLIVEGENPTIFTGMK